MSLRDRGQVISGRRITIPDKIADTIDVQVGDFFEIETIGKNMDKLLITFFKVGKRKVEDNAENT
jgi:bifunctional DNA-binding transcriptional regulator/antitoxin component of YhaV-PrlF toxin-antitoxin module